LAADLVIKNAKIVTTEGIYEAGIAIADGKIAAIAKDPNLPQSDKVIDAHGLPLMPGAIDPHVHLGLYNPFGEDVPDTTMVQALGGLTTTMHSILDKRSLKVAIPELTEIAEKEAYIDMTFYAAIMSMQHILELPAAFELGVTSFKHFTNRPEYEMLNILHPDDGEFYLSFEKIKELGGVAMVHCEDFEIARKLTERVKASGAKDLAAWNDSRPDFCEQLKLWEMAIMAKITGCPLYVVHTTVATAKEVVDWARANDVEIIIETTPTYLAFVKTDKKVGILGKINPPIRTASHVEGLWQGIKDGWVDCIGSDHCPLTKSRKVGQGDIWSAMLAFPSSELMFPYMISEGFSRRGIPLERIAQLTSTKTAEIHSIPNKGAIRVGYDADVVIVDPKKRVRIDDKVLHYSQIRDFSLFEGETFTGFPVTTIVRGQVVAQDGQVVGKRGYGKVVKRVPRKGPKKPTLKQLLD
jgi:dihydropyrimidinase